ncbi:MAG: DUF2914 domain-containing protein [Deltaproteobacteria bacterium]|nr:DUF2914 domain-containing protein [Deltaproteobacteria bacterium]
MRAKIFLGLSIIFFLPVIALAQGSAGLTVDDIRICTSVEDRQPIGADTSFDSDVGRLFCFTKLSGDQENSTIYHVWYFNDKEVSRIELSVRAKTWRTWSNKNILNTWTGNWRVDVLTSEGNVLGSMEFTVRE